MRHHSTFLFYRESQPDWHKMRIAAYKLSLLWHVLIIVIGLSHSRHIRHSGTLQRKSFEALQQYTDPSTRSKRSKCELRKPTQIASQCECSLVKDA